MYQRSIFILIQRSAHEPSDSNEDMAVSLRHDADVAVSVAEWPFPLGMQGRRNPQVYNQRSNKRRRSDNSL